VAAPATALDPVLVVLGDGDGDLRDLVLLIAVDHAEIPCAGQVVAAVTAAFGEPILLRIRGVGPRQMRPRRPGLLAPRPLGPTRPRCLSGGAGLPGSSSFEGGFEEFPELRDSRCSSRASLAASASLASISSAICPACALICPAWRRTTTISSSRDISD
jgi:hypothetical protein